MHNSHVDMQIESMPQFKMIPSREKILARIPEYAVIIEPFAGDVTIHYQDTLIAESSAALLVKETRHDDVIYLPRNALKQEYFQATEHSTYCPFKGHANYWQLTLNEVLEDNIVWSYENPYEEVSSLKDYVSFYTDRTKITLRA
jgi:uncharacterized protein (DUF427 family)